MERSPSFVWCEVIAHLASLVGAGQGILIASVPSIFAPEKFEGMRGFRQTNGDAHQGNREPESRGHTRKCDVAGRRSRNSSVSVLKIATMSAGASVQPFGSVR
jgi:hypothetical protein